MGVSFSFYAVDWAGWRKASTAQRSGFVWQPADPALVRAVVAHDHVQQWEFAVEASDCWESMRSALDDAARRMYDGVFGALFWDSPFGPRQDLTELVDAKLSLAPDSVAELHHALVDDDIDGLEPFFDACCRAEGLFPTFLELRRYIARWAALLARTRATEALVGL